MKSHLLVVPHGTGIGDTVNVRPLLEAIIEHRDNEPVFVLIPPGLEWLLPAGALPAPQSLIARFWRRPELDGRLSTHLGQLTARETARLVRPGVLRVLAQGLTCLLQAEGFEVISFLQSFAQLDLDRRWTAGSWSTDRQHVIDLLAETLEQRGIPVPAGRRSPRLQLEPRPPGRATAVVISPNAGSTLKEPGTDFWVKVAHGLIRHGIRPFVLSAPRRGTGQEIVRQVSGAALLEETALPQLAARLAGADLVISPDSGNLHLAAAAGVRFVGLFGPTDPLLLGPRPREGGVLLETTIQHASICRGCCSAQLLPAARCALLHSPGCVTGISTERVVETALELLDRSSGGSDASVPRPV